MREKFLTAEVNNKRLDTYISTKVEDLTRSMVQKLIRDGKVTINGKIEKESYKVKIDDKISIEIDDPKENKGPGHKIEKAAA